MSRLHFATVLELLTALGAIAAAIGLGVPLALYLTRSLLRSRRRSAGIAVMSALLFSFPFLNGRDTELIDEARDAGSRRRNDHSGDPPEPKAD